MADYYATTLPPGPARLGEMLEESAFYSEHLQRISAVAMLVVLVFFAVLFFVIVFGITPYVGRDTGLAIVRVFLALLVFGMSADVVGAYRAHRDAAKDIRDIRQRLMTADAAGYPPADVLLAFADYNAAVESAPESVPYAYALRGEHLNQRWADYKRDRDDRRAAQGRAMKHVNLFKEFLNDTVNLNDTRIGDLETSIEAIKNVVRDSDWEPHLNGWMAHGSWAHKTIIRPVDSGEFDADLIVFVEHVEGWTAATYIEELYSAFRA